MVDGEHHDTKLMKLTVVESAGDSCLKLVEDDPKSPTIANYYFTS